MNVHSQPERRERILVAALELFAERGYAATPVRAVAERAGVAQGLLYRYFDGKAGVLGAILERSAEDVRASFAHADGGAGARDRLERLVEGAFDVVEANRDFWTLLYRLRLQPNAAAALPDAARELPAEIRSALAHYLASAGHPRPETAARALFAAIDGAAQHWALEPDSYPRAAVAAEIVAAFAPGEGDGPS